MSCSFSKEACVPECPAKKLLTESWRVREIMVEVLDRRLGEQAAHEEADRTFRLNEEFAEFLCFLARNSLAQTKRGQISLALTTIFLN